MMIRGDLRSRLRSEDGAVMVLSALVIIVLFAAVAFVIDLSRLWHERQVLQNAVDFGALAGAQELPANDATTGSVAAAEALRVTLDNAPWLTPAQVTISFRCIVGDRDGDGAPDLSDVPTTCGPQSGTWPAEEWRTRRGRSIHLCNPFAGDRCNTVAVQTSNAVDYIFAPVIGVDSGNTGSVSAASCRGSCGAAPAPLDVAVVFDRSRSMTEADMDNARNATLSLLDFYDSAQHHVGLVGLPYHNPTNRCLVRTSQTYPNATPSTWILNGLSTDYDRADGTLNPASQIVQTINCLQRAPSNVTTNPSGAGHTDLGDPMAAASSMLQTAGRADVPDVIIFLSDGEANQPRFNQPCSYANTRATAAKTADVEIFTIAYGVAGARCGEDSAGTFRNAYASLFFAAMATDSIDDSPGGCAVTENSDGDHYFCESLSSDLEPVFRQVAEQALGHSRLVDDL
jgi:Mg-chelatase subunit ChlD